MNNKKTSTTSYYMHFRALATCIFILSQTSALQAQKLAKHAFEKDNLAAWCIVPFDAIKRGPEERANMLNDIGIKKLAYDWREEHIPTFDEELDALNKYGIKLEAFWIMSGPDPDRDANLNKIFDFLARNGVKTQLWLLMGDWDGVNDLSQADRILEYAKPIKQIAERAQKIGCKVALYNHGGWFGEPENQLAIISHLKLPNLGMVYNFHHARQHHERFADFFPKIKPHLYALNIAGLRKGVTERFYRTGEGNLEADMIKLVWKSGYRGTIGIINHDTEADAKVALLQEMEGLKKILATIGNKKALKTYK